MADLFFWFSKLAWFLVTPGNVLLLALVAGVVLLFTRWQRTSRLLLVGVAVFSLLIATLPVGDWLIYSQESRYPPEPITDPAVDGIVVMSGAIDPLATQAWAQPVIGGAAERLITFAALARTYPKARLVFTGGSGRLLSQDLKTADVARQVLHSLGVDDARLQFERESRNSRESAENTLKMVKPGTGEKWLLVTSALHMHRALGAFCRVGWQMIPYPVDYRSRPHRMLSPTWTFSRNLRALESGVKEWLGSLVYDLMGKSC